MRTAPPSRLRPAAADALRAAVAEAGGVEIFAVGRVDVDGCVTEVEVHARGQAGAVNAVRGRAHPGDVVLHNHPSGVLLPSDADLSLAGAFGDDGIGFVIFDNDAKRATWVVEPHRREPRALDLADVRAFFTEAMPRAMPGHEARPGQAEMAAAVGSGLNAGAVRVLEAETGTGKSLAYLVPSAHWALANNSRVVVSTYTLTLQGQLASSDIPVLGRAGLVVRTAILRGRTNYLCKRRLAEALEDTPADAPQRASLDALAAWAAHSSEGTRQELSFPLEDGLWEQVESDHDQTLRAKCPHYNECFYYGARRRAADAHLLVVNHALLLADLAVRQETGKDGILPRYERAVIDEAHHLEDAATSLFSGRVTARSLRYAVGKLLDRKQRLRARGALGQLYQRFVDDPRSSLPGDRRDALAAALDAAGDACKDLSVHAAARVDGLAVELLDPARRPALRFDRAFRAEPQWPERVEPALRLLDAQLVAATDALARVVLILADLSDEDRARQPQPLFDVERASRRLTTAHRVLQRVLSNARDDVAWAEIARAGRQGAMAGAICAAPIEVAPKIRAALFDAVPGVTLTSATLRVNRSFAHHFARVGLEGPGLPPPEGLEAAFFASPFDYPRQAVLGLPRDLPPPEAAGWDTAIGDAVVAAVEAARGGAFVLCTSHDLAQILHRHAARALGDRFPLLLQDGGSKDLLLERFRAAGNAVLFGTDSFWEGVSVAGAALRLVIIPRLPFRVPTEPVQAARYEAIQERGGDPFREYALPQAILRLRQGFGRLIRTGRDRGAVLVLDRRVHDRWYGRVFLNSLPPAAQATGPLPAVLERVRSTLGIAPVDRPPPTG